MISVDTTSASSDVTNHSSASNDVTDKSTASNDDTNHSSASNDATDQSTLDAGSWAPRAKVPLPGAPETAAVNKTVVPLTAGNDSSSQTSINLEDPLSKPAIEKTLKVLEQLANQLHVNSAAAACSDSNLTGVVVSDPAEVGPPKRRASSSQLFGPAESAGLNQTSSTIRATSTEFQSNCYNFPIARSGSNSNFTYGRGSQTFLLVTPKIVVVFLNLATLNKSCDPLNLKIDHILA